MSKNPIDSNDSDSVTSSTDQETSDKDSDNNDSDGGGRSYKSLTFSKRTRKSTTHLKSKKTGKRVRFKPGDSLVLIYIIPNREMLGLKSASEDSDDYYEESDDESEDDDNDDEVSSEEEEEDEEVNDSSDDQSDDEEDEESDENKNLKKKQKPFAKLLAARQINTCNTKRRCSAANTKPAGKTQDRPINKLINLTLVNEPSKVKKKNKKLTKRREKKEKPQKPPESPPETKTRAFRRRQRSVSLEKDKSGKFKRTKPRIIEINATIDARSVGTPAVPRVLFKHDLKLNGASVAQYGGKPMTQRGRIQQVSLRAGMKTTRPNSAPKPSSHHVQPPRPHSAVRRSVPTLPNIADKPKAASRAVSASYESLTSVLPDTYTNVVPYYTDGADESVNRLDPDCMNNDSRRHYAWQIANGTITSQSLRTPSILPFWDSLQGQTTDKLSSKC